eukprot:TRINITY_DN3391_c0_g1_i1.p1 TRINITY_DN3391_c0_g1~~TRINITY_DN3391_c0_g1_i1.p1  ORF type:complete len:440 (+),score=73.65 TRINITY_DN3391_c0_g1_i1:53-1372(+)
MVVLTTSRQHQYPIKKVRSPPMPCTPLSPMSPYSPGTEKYQRKQLLTDVSPIPPPRMPTVATAKLPQYMPPAPVSASQPVVSEPTHVHQRPRTMTTYQAMEAFSFGEPPSPRSKIAEKSAPPVGQPIHTPKVKESSEDVISRFLNMMRTLVNTASRSQTELLPHLSPTEIVKSLVRRVNEFTDSGAARGTPNYKIVFDTFVQLLSIIFTTRLGKDVRASALVELLGSIFDMKLAPDYCSHWVSGSELKNLNNLIIRGADPLAGFSALLLMLRQQCCLPSIDKEAIRLCINDLIPMSSAAARQTVSDPTLMLKELYRFTDAHETHWASMSSRYSLSDHPDTPSPLGTLSYVIKTLLDIQKGSRVRHGLREVGIPETARLYLLVDKIDRRMREKERETREQPQQKRAPGLSQSLTYYKEVKGSHLTNMSPRQELKKAWYGK